MAALGAALASQETARAERAYIAQLLWQIGAQLYALAGGRWTTPDFFTVFPPRRTPGMNAAQIKQSVLDALEGRTHGRTV